MKVMCFQSRNQDKCYAVFNSNYECNLSIPQQGFWQTPGGCTEVSGYLDSSLSHGFPIAIALGPLALVSKLLATKSSIARPTEAHDSRTRQSPPATYLLNGFTHRDFSVD